jgi:hypothetical protein
MWQYNYTPNPNDILHYGVPGMRWGHRNRRAMKIEARTTRKLQKSGQMYGKSDYYKTKGAKAAQNHNKMATAFNKQAKTYESQGKALKAEAARRASSALKARGANVKAQNDAIANRYEAKANKKSEKAKAYASKKHVDIGAKKINEIISGSKQKGYDSAKKQDKAVRESELENRLGESNYERLNKIRGRG